MNSRQLKVTKAIALFLVFSVSQICVQASLLGTSTAASSATSKRIATLLTRGNYPISVNGNSAASGMTVFSGAQLLTPEKVGATVRIEGLGQLDLAPDTNASLNFDHNQVSVNLAGGYAVLTTNKNVNGLIATAEGIVTHTDAAKGSSVAAQSGNQDTMTQSGTQDNDKDKKDKKKKGAAGDDSGNAGAGSGSGAGTGGANAVGSFPKGLAIAIASIAGGGAAAYGIYRATRNPCARGANPSPGTPRGSNSGCNR